MTEPSTPPQSPRTTALSLTGACSSAPERPNPPGPPKKAAEVLQRRPSIPSTFYDYDLHARSFTSLDEIKQRLGIPQKSSSSFVPRFHNPFTMPYLASSERGAAKAATPSSATVSSTNALSTNQDGRSPSSSVPARYQSLFGNPTAEGQTSLGSASQNWPSSLPDVQRNSPRFPVPRRSATSDDSLEVKPGFLETSILSTRPKRLVPQITMDSDFDSGRSQDISPYPNKKPCLVSPSGVNVREQIISSNSPQGMKTTIENDDRITLSSDQKDDAVVQRDESSQVSSPRGCRGGLVTGGDTSKDSPSADINSTEPKRDETTFKSEESGSLAMEVEDLDSKPNGGENVDDVQISLDKDDEVAIAVLSDDVGPAADEEGEVMRDGARVAEDELEPRQDTQEEEVRPVSSDEKKTFDLAAMMRLRNDFIETVEELRMRRRLDAENEAKITQLLGEKHNVERKLLDEVTKSSNQIAEHERHVEVIRRESSDRIKEFETKEAKHQMTRNCHEQELRKLKDEIKTLQINKYSLEKKVAELEHVIHLYNTMKDSTYSQVSACEKSSKALETRFEGVAEVQSRLEKNVKKAMEMNKKLEFVNQHQLCQIDDLKSDITRLKQENLDQKVALEIKPRDFDQKILIKCQEVERLQLLLQKKETENERFTKQLEERTEQKQALMKSMNAAHELVGQQVKCNEQNLADIKQLETDLKNLKEKYDVLTKKYDEKAAEYDNECSVHQAALEEWKSQEESLSSRLDTLRQDHEALMKAHSDLEDLNSSRAQKNIALMEEIREMKAKYEKETAETSTQTEQDMTSLSTQTDEDLIGRIAELEEIVEKKEKEMESLKDKVDFFEEIAKGAGRLRETVEDMKKEMKAKETQIQELSEEKIKADQSIQISVSVSEDFTQTSQEFPTSRTTLSDVVSNDSKEDTVKQSVATPIVSGGELKPSAMEPQTSGTIVEVVVPESPEPPAEEPDAGVGSIMDAAQAAKDDKKAKSPCDSPASDTSDVRKDARYIAEKKSGGTVKDIVKSSPKRSTKLGRESCAKYLASMIHSDLDEESQTFRSQELNEALHSRLARKMALLRGETRRSPRLDTLSVLSNAPKKRSLDLSPRGGSPLASSAKRGRTRPTTTILPSTARGSAFLTSPIMPSTAELLRLPITTTATTCSKSLAKPSPIYADSCLVSRSPPKFKSPTILSPSIVMGSKDSSAFCCIPRTTKSPNLSPIKAAEKTTPTGSPQTSSPMFSSNSECVGLTIGKRKSQELGAGDASGSDGMGAPLGQFVEETDEQPKAKATGILIDAVPSRPRLAKRVRFDSQAKEQSFEEHWDNVQKRRNHGNSEEKQRADTPPATAPAAPPEGEELLFSDDEDVLVI